MGKLTYLFVIIFAVFFYSIHTSAGGQNRKTSLIIITQNSSITNALLREKAISLLKEEGFEIEDSINYTTPQESYLSLRIDLNNNTLKLSASFSAIGGNTTGTKLYPELSASITNMDEIKALLKKYIDKNLK